MKLREIIFCTILMAISLYLFFTGMAAEQEWRANRYQGLEIVSIERR